MASKLKVCNKFQVQIGKNRLRKYIGAIPTEMQAARIYDKYMIITKGIKVSHFLP